MKLFKPRVNKERQAMLVRLYKLRYEYRYHPQALRRLSDFQLYADIGKDRKTLGMDWAEKAEEACKDAIAFEQMMAEITGQTS